MLQFIFCRDSRGVLGYELNGKFRQPIISKEDRKFFQQNVKNTKVLMGGNTLRSMLDEGYILPGDVFVFTRDRSIIAEARKKNPYVEQLDSKAKLFRFIEESDAEQSTVSCIGGAVLFGLLEDEVDKVIVTEFLSEGESKGERIIFAPKYGSCLSGDVEPGFVRVDCKKFEGLDDQNQPVTGYFAEYTRA